VHNILGCSYLVVVVVVYLFDTEVNAHFLRLLVAIFSTEFLDDFKAKRSAGWLDLMLAFESCKRSSNLTRDFPLNVTLPFSFIDHHQKHFVRYLTTSIINKPNIICNDNSSASSVTITTQMYSPDPRSGDRRTMSPSFLRSRTTRNETTKNLKIKRHELTIKYKLSPYSSLF